ncbi:MAG TPA: PEP/pyruvate-binding domain-containing protein, partial [Pirellulaceae bacterium]|nr:PEP/pyruvate-binding domain-containing protein [Pirellulaceae bacterium]
MVEPVAGNRTSERPQGSELVVSLSELSTRFSDSRHAVAECGGKAANLARVATLGLSVPPGFVVTCSAWGRRVAQSAGDPDVESESRCNGADDFGSEVGGVEARDNAANESHERAPEQVREKIPHEVRDEIAKQLAALPGSGLVVVRSSAVGEDSAHAAFAGLLASELDVPAELDAVLAALSRCWASYSAPRVAAYQAARGVALSGMAVLVQRQVSPSWAGVLFTRSPMSDGRSQLSDNPTREMLVEYCEGLGEKLVSGEVSPGRLVIECKAGTEPHWRLNAPWRGGIRAESTADARAEDLPERVIRQLFEAAGRIEAHFNAPQDIEWASDSEDRLFIVQSRPITVIANRHETGSHEDASRLDDDESAELWSNVNVNENYPEPITPVLFSIAELGYYHYFRGLGEQLGVARRRIATVESSLRRIVGLHGARLYYNLTNIHRVLRAAPLGDWLANAFDQFVGVHDEASGFARSDDEQQANGNGRPANRSRSDSTSRSDGSETAPTVASRQPARISRPLTQRLRDGWEVAGIFWKAWRTVGRLESHVARFERRVAAIADAARPEQLAGKTSTQLSELIAEFIEIRSHGWLDAAVGDAASMATYALLKQMLRREFPESDQAALHNSLLKGQRDLVSTLPARELAKLADRVRENPTWRSWIENASVPQAGEQLRTNPELAPLARLFDAWLDAWGFRCSGELLLTQPSFQERPDEALSLLKRYVG